MSIESLYQDLLGRGVDPSGAATYAGWSDQDIQNAITSSPEYAQRQQQQQQPQQQQPQQQQDGGGADINSIYQQYLGRGVDPSGAATYAGWNPQDIVNAIKGSPEYAQSHGGGGSNGVQAPAGANPQDLANQIFSLYRTNQNYDQQLNQLNSLPQNADYYKARIGLLGSQMGWQTGQNTGGNNAVLQNELNSYIPGALQAGLTQDQINSLIGQNSAQQSAVNQERIASDAKAPQGWVNQNIPGGYGTLAAAAALGLGGAGALGLFGEGALGAGAVGAGEAAGTAALASPGVDLAALVAEYPGISEAQLADLAGQWGLDSFGATDAARMALSGYDAATIDQLLQYGYSASELAGTGLQSLASTLPGAAGTSTLADLLKGAKSVIGTGAPLMKALGSVGGAKGLSGALKNPTGTTNTGSTGSTGMGATFAQAKGNQNPFYFGTQTPVASPSQSKVDPFAALNVQQMTPQQQYNPLAALLKEGIYRG